MFPLFTINSESGSSGSVEDVAVLNYPNGLYAKTAKKSSQAANPTRHLRESIAHVIPRRSAMPVGGRLPGSGIPIISVSVVQDDVSPAVRPTVYEMVMA